MANQNDRGRVDYREPLTTLPVSKMSTYRYEVRSETGLLWVGQCRALSPAAASAALALANPDFYIVCEG